MWGQLIGLLVLLVCLNCRADWYVGIPPSPEGDYPDYTGETLFSLPPLNGREQVGTTELWLKWFTADPSQWAVALWPGGVNPNVHNAITFFGSMDSTMAENLLQDLNADYLTPAAGVALVGVQVSGIGPLVGTGIPSQITDAFNFSAVPQFDLSDATDAAAQTAGGVRDVFYGVLLFAFCVALTVVVWQLVERLVR